MIQLTSAKGRRGAIRVEGILGGRCSTLLPRQVKSLGAKLAQLWGNLGLYFDAIDTLTHLPFSRFYLVPEGEVLPSRTCPPI
jgi:hypothetical protein